MVADGPEDAEPLKIVYRFTFKGGDVQEFKTVLDGWNLSARPDQRSSYPDWTRLKVEQCSNCPLDEKKHAHCPVALNLSDVIEYFKDHISSDQCELEIMTPARNYHKKVSVAEAASALIGLRMATSGCPIMDQLKPMARTHLPFPTLEETLYRMLGMYMVAQYFRVQDGKEPDWKMHGLVSIINEIRQVNKGFCARLYKVCSQDANLNAIVHLDCFADNSAFLIEKKGLDQIRSTFEAYLKKD